MDFHAAVWFPMLRRPLSGGPDGHAPSCGQGNAWRPTQSLYSGRREGVPNVSIVVRWVPQGNVQMDRSALCVAIRYPDLFAIPEVIQKTKSILCRWLDRRAKFLLIVSRISPPFFGNTDCFELGALPKGRLPLPCASNPPLCNDTGDGRYLGP